MFLSDTKLAILHIVIPEGVTDKDQSIKIQNFNFLTPDKGHIFDQFFFGQKFKFLNEHR